MSVYQDRGAWRAEWRGVKRRCKTRTEAKQMETLLKRGFGQTGGSPDAEASKLSEVLTRARKAGQWRGAQELVVLRDVTSFIETVGDLRIDAIATEHLDRWVNETMGSLADRTINRKLSAVSSVLSWAKKRSIIKDKPHIPLRRLPEPHTRWITGPEELRLLHTLTVQGAHDVALSCIVAFDTGLRMGELQRLQAKHVQDGWLHVWQSKNKRTRSIKLTERAGRALVVLLRSPGASREDETSIPSYGRIRTQWAKAKRAMGLEGDKDFVRHTMRHTTATRLVKRGANIRVVQEYLGHSSLQMTQRYAKVARADIAEAAGLLG